MRSPSASLIWEIAGPQPATHRFSTRWFTDTHSAGPTFEVGVSDPALDWPRIHPGPLNEHTGYRELSATVDFDVVDSTDQWHVVEIEAREASGPCPDLRFEVNGHRALVVAAAVREDRRHDPMPPSPIAGVIDQELWVPPGILTVGRNRLVVTTVAAHPVDTTTLGRQQRPDLGSWFGSTIQWLRLALRRGPADATPPVPRPSVTMTPLYERRSDGALTEIVELTVHGVADLHRTAIAIELNGERCARDAAADDHEFGDVRLRFAVPEFTGSQQAQVDMTGRESTMHSCVAARKWTVHVIPHVHLDIGYTDMQAKVIELHSSNIDKALGVIDSDPDWAFSVDGSFIVQQYLRSRTGERAELTMAALRSGRLSVNAIWALVLSGVATLEDLYRSMYFAAELARKYDIPITYANLTDVPSYSAAIPSILASAGIDSFVGISNHIRGGNADSDALHLLSPVRWRGSDGAEVLAFFSDCYSQLRWVCGDPVSIPGAAQGISRFVSRYDRDDYLPDHLPLVGTHSDNEDLSHGYAGFVQKWNEAYEWPRLRFSTIADYLDSVRPLLDRLPELVGDGGSYWEDGVGTQAAAVAVLRATQSLLPSVEALSALVTGATDGLRPDIELLDEIWQHVLIGSEHTWTSTHASLHPHSHHSHDQLDWKVSRIRRGHGLTVDEARRALSQLAEQITTTDVPAVLVVNPTSFKRTAVVEVELAAGTVVVDQAGEIVAADPAAPTDGLYRTRLRLEDLEPFEYRLLPIRGGRSEGDAAVSAPERLDTGRYDATLDPHTGALTGLVSKVRGWDVLDSSSPWTLGDILYVSGGGSSQTRGMGEEVTSLFDCDPALPRPELVVETATLGSATLRRTPWGHVLTRSGSGPTMATIVQHIEFFDDADRVEVTIEFDKTPTLAKESIYVAFPFAVEAPTVRYDRQQGWVAPATDHQVGACNEWLTVQNAVSVSNDARMVAWSSADAPLFTVSDVVRGTWARTFHAPNATILSWVMNNYWWTNTPAQQGGHLRLRYAFTVGDAVDDAAAGRLGRELRSQPLVDEMTYNDRCDDAPRQRPMSGTLYPVDVPDNVVVSVYPSRFGAAFTVRVQDFGGTATQVRLPHPVTAGERWASTATATETLLDPLPLDDSGHIYISLAPHEVRTVCFGLS